MEPLRFLHGWGVELHALSTITWKNNIFQISDRRHFFLCAFTLKMRDDFEIKRATSLRRPNKTKTYIIKYFIKP